MQVTQLSSEESAQGIWLKAGPLKLLFHDGDVRSVRWGDREVLRRIYGAVRDEHWGTVPGAIHDLEFSTTEDTFRIGFKREHREGEIHFVWLAEISGDSNGTIRYSMEGEARAAFLTNRVGLCVLHPLRECAGQRCRTYGANGHPVERVFPHWIASEQPVEGFSPLTRIDHEVSPGVWAEVRLEGDHFEMEDQRNWIDASFKIYSTDVRLPVPVRFEPGTRIRQSIEVRLNLDAPRNSIVSMADPVRQKSVTLRLRGEDPVRLPELGLCIASHGRRLEEREIVRLSRIGIGHLRVDLRFSDGLWFENLRTAARDALELGAALELAIHLPAKDAWDLTVLAKVLGRMKVDLTRAMIFREGVGSTRPEDLEAAQRALGDCGMAIGAGTDSDLFQLSQQPPPLVGDFVCWSMNPQVHSIDELTIAESPEAVVHQLMSARRRYAGLPLVITPVTLRRRVRPARAVVGEPADPVASDVSLGLDSRQRSLFAGAWTVAMMKALAEGGVESLTLFETTGAWGVMESEAGSPWPDLFPSTPGEVYPIYHVLESMSRFGGGRVIPMESSEPASVVPLLVESGSRRLILANLSRDVRRVDLANQPGIQTVRSLDPSTEAEARLAPEKFRSGAMPVHDLELNLPPHGIVVLDYADD